MALISTASANQNKNNMQTKVIFIRHGESLGNVNPEFYSYPDDAIILSELGVRQALKLRTALQTYLPPDFYGVHTQVITSELMRAKLTQKIAMADVNLKLPVLSDARLNEVYHVSHGVHDETGEEVKARVRSLVEQYPFHLVLFCHGMLMGEIDPARGGARNCEVRVYGRNDLLTNYLN